MEKKMSGTTDDHSYKLFKLDILQLRFSCQVTTKINNSCRILCDKIVQDLIKINEGHEMMLY